MGFYFNGGGYIIPPPTGFDRLIIKLGIRGFEAQQALNLRPDIQTAITNYLNQNGDGGINLEYAYWAQAYLIENPSADASVFVSNNLANYITDAEMESIFNNLSDPLSDDGVDLYLVVKY